MDVFINKHNFKLKDTGPSSYHLAYEFSRYFNNQLCLANRNAVSNIPDSCVSIFGLKPKSICHSSLEKVDHPELGILIFLDADGVQ